MPGLFKEINFLSLVTREISIKTAFGKTHEEFKEAVKLIVEDSIDLSPLISGIIPFSSINEGFISTARERVKNLVDLCT